jgi:hypothetical protein
MVHTHSRHAELAAPVPSIGNPGAHLIGKNTHRGMGKTAVFSGQKIRNTKEAFDSIAVVKKMFRLLASR